MKLNQTRLNLLCALLLLSPFLVTAAEPKTKKLIEFGWGENRIEEADMKRAIDELRATKFQRFTDNFFRFNTTPAKLDWFDDYSTIIHNCRIAAWTAKQGGVKGLLFDIDKY